MVWSSRYFIRTVANVRHVYNWRQLTVRLKVVDILAIAKINLFLSPKKLSKILQSSKKTLLELSSKSLFLSEFMKGKTRNNFGFGKNIFYS